MHDGSSRYRIGGTWQAGDGGRGGRIGSTPGAGVSARLPSPGRRRSRGQGFIAETPAAGKRYTGERGKLPKSQTVAQKRQLRYDSTNKIACKGNAQHTPPVCVRRGAFYRVFWEDT